MTFKLQKMLSHKITDALTYLALTIAVLYVYDGAQAMAQATCTSVVSYNVERTIEKNDKVTTDVFFAELKIVSADEPSSRAKLEIEVLKAKSLALERCKNEFENTSGCLQSKMASTNRAMQAASFAARKAMEEAFLADCKKGQGVCKEAKATEVKCTVIEPTPTPDPKAKKK